MGFTSVFFKLVYLLLLVSNCLHDMVQIGLFSSRHKSASMTSDKRIAVPVMLNMHKNIVVTSLHNALHFCNIVLMYKIMFVHKKNPISTTINMAWIVF